MGRGGKLDLTPTVEKERVSNYDPNKKQYVRQNDPERGTQDAAACARSGGYEDDEVVRGGKRKKKQPQPDVRKVRNR